MDHLGVRRSLVALSDNDPLLKPGNTHLAMLEWTIDGVPLSDLIEARGLISVLYKEADPADRRETLHRLRGDRSDLPVFTPRFERSAFDKLLRRRGTPWAISGPAFEDGRVSLLGCTCGDLDCGALTAQVVVTDNTVEWRDVGWQVTYEPFEGFNEVVSTYRFERNEYSALLDDLLTTGWDEGL